MKFGWDGYVWEGTVVSGWRFVCIEDSQGTNESSGTLPGLYNVCIWPLCVSTSCSMLIVQWE